MRRRRIGSRNVSGAPDSSRARLQRLIGRTEKLIRLADESTAV